MIAALAKAAGALNEPCYAEMAQRAADFILQRMRAADGGLRHRYREGEAAIEGNLDDYAFMTWGLIELYETTFEVRYLQAALELNSYTLKEFWDNQEGGFYFTASRQERILVRSKEVYDGAVPSGNAVSMLNLLRLARMTGRSEWEEKASQLSGVFARSIQESPSAYTQWMIGLDFALGPSFEVVISGDPAAEDTQAMLQALRCRFIPNAVILLRPTSPEVPEIVRLAEFTKTQTSLHGKATAYVCKNFQCQAPTTDIQEMLRSLNALR